LLSMSSEKARRKGMRPHWRFSRLLTDVEVVKAKTGQSGRQRESREAMWPVFVKTKTASTPRPLAADGSGFCLDLSSKQMDSNILSDQDNGQ
jgi:hypothetical protein